MDSGTMKAIQDEIASAGFHVVQKRVVTLTRGQAHDFYSQHIDKFFYDRLVTHMASKPILAMVLKRESAIATWRTMIGPANVFRTVHSAPGTLRARYGLTDTRNALHGSDSEASTLREIAFFFPDFRVSDIPVNNAMQTQGCSETSEFTDNHDRQ